MVIGLDEQEKTLDEAINFNKDNIFEYLSQIIYERNGNLYGEKSNDILREILSLLEALPGAEYNIISGCEDLVNQALVETSQYAYSSGFREACRLMHTLHSF